MTSPSPAAQGDATLPRPHWVAEDLRNLVASAPERPAHHSPAGGAGEGRGHGRAQAGR